MTSSQQGTQNGRPKNYYSPMDLKKFVKGRDATPLAWSMFGALIFSLILVLIIFICPGWAWTLEVHTYVTFEGSMYGHYGLWYSCWSLSSDEWRSDDKTECELMLDLKKIPFWWKICQGLSICLLLLGTTVLAITGAYCYIKTIARNIKLVMAINVMCAIQALLAVALFTVWCVLFLNSVYWCCPSGAMQMLQWKLHYCFVICCTLPVFYLTTAFMGAKEIYNLRTPYRLEQYHKKVASTRKKFEASYADFHQRSADQQMMAYHPGVQQSYMPRPFAHQNSYGPMQPYDGPTPALFGPQQPEEDLQLQVQEVQKGAETPKEKPLGPDELDLTAELAY